MSGPRFFPRLFFWPFLIRYLETSELEQQGLATVINEKISNDLLNKFSRGNFRPERVPKKNIFFLSFRLFRGTWVKSISTPLEKPIPDVPWLPKMPSGLANCDPERSWKTPPGFSFTSWRSRFHRRPATGFPGPDWNPPPANFRRLLRENIFSRSVIFTPEKEIFQRRALSAEKLIPARMHLRSNWTVY